MILPSIWCVNPAILWWRCLCFSPQTFFLRFMSCCFFLFSFLLSTRHLFVVLYTNRSPEFTDWIPTMCSSNVLYLCACPFSLRSSVMIIIFSSPSPPPSLCPFWRFHCPKCLHDNERGVVLLFINRKTQPQRETPWSSHRLFSEALCRLLSLRFNFHTVYFWFSNQDRRSRFSWYL